MDCAENTEKVLWEVLCNCFIAVFNQSVSSSSCLVKVRPVHKTTSEIL